MGDSVITDAPLIDEILLLLSQDTEALQQKDLSEYLVVFPGKRPSHYLKLALARKIGTAYRPPVIMSIEEFIDYAYERVLSEQGRRCSALEGIKVLYDVVNATGAWRVGLEEFLSTGGVLFRDIEEMRLEGITPEALRARDVVLEGISSGASERLLRLSRVYEQFYDRLNYLGMTTRASRYEAVATKAQEVLQSLEGSFKRIIFAGFYGFTKLEAHLFRVFLDSPRVVLFFRYGRHLMEQLQRQGIHWTDRRGQDQKGYPEIEFVPCPDRHGQIGAFRVKAGLSLVPDIGTAMVLPEPSLLPVVLRFGLSGFQQHQYNITMGYPLYRTPIYGFFLCLLQLLASRFQDRFYLKDYIQLIMHPYTKNIFSPGTRDPEPTRQMLQGLKEALLTEGATFWEPEEIETLAGHARDTLRYLHKMLIGPLLRVSGVRDFVKALKDVLLFIYKHSTAAYHPLFQPYAERFLEVFDEVSESIWAEVSMQDMMGYMAFFKKVMARQSCPFEGTPLRGLQVLGLLETRGLAFDRVFIFDCNEDVLPGSTGPETFIPNYSRRLLGLPTQTDRARLMEYYFDSLIRGARKVMLFYVQDDRRRRSPFVERLLWEKEKATEKTVKKEDLESLTYRFRIKNPVPEPVAKTPLVVETLRNMEFSASAIDEYLRCGLRFYYRYVLGLTETTEPEDTDRAGIGRLVHEVLAEFFRPRTGKLLGPHDLSPEEIEKVLGARFPESRLRVFGPLALVRRQVSRRLQEFLVQFYGALLQQGPLKVLAVEQSLTAHTEGLRLSGRIDQVYTQAARVVIIDYKTSSTAQNYRIRWDRIDPTDRRSWPEHIGSLQMPFYLYLYSLAKGVPYDSLRGGYIMLGTSTRENSYFYSPFEEKGLKENMAVAEKIILALMKEVLEPERPFEAPEDLRRTCQYCAYTGICGTQWVV